MEIKLLEMLVRSLQIILSYNRHGEALLVLRILIKNESSNMKMLLKFAMIN